MPTKIPPPSILPPTQGSPSIWRLLVARFCLRISEFELSRGRYGHVARFCTKAASKMGRAASRIGKEDWNKLKQDRITIRGPEEDGSYIVEFKIADGEALAISVPRGETAVLKHFQAKIPYGLKVPEVPRETEMGGSWDT
jgi:hypothetical protein